LSPPKTGRELDALSQDFHPGCKQTHNINLTASNSNGQFIILYSDMGRIATTLFR